MRLLRRHGLTAYGLHNDEDLHVEPGLRRFQVGQGVVWGVLSIPRYIGTSSEQEVLGWREGRIS